MALKGTITGKADNGKYKLTCDWTATQSIANNTSTITAKVYLQAPSGWSTVSSYWNCTINGTQVTTNKSATVGSTAVLLGTRTWTVSHASNGTLSTTISFSYSNGLTSAGTYTTKSGSGSASVTLDTIPRTSSFTLSSSSLAMGSSQTVAISRASSSFTHTVQYTFGSTTTTVADKTTATSVSFTPPVSLASQVPKATSGTCTVKVTTYNGSTSIGTASKTFTLTVPSSVKPTVSLKATYNNTLSGLSIAGKSTVTVTPTGTGSYGSTISSYSYSGAGLSGTGSSKTTGTLSSGSYTITVTVTDSRGRTGTANVSFTVHAYSNPTLSISVYRADANGNKNGSGEYARAQLTYKISNPNNANTNAKQYKIEWKQASSSSAYAVLKDWTNFTGGYTSTSDSTLDLGGGWRTTVSYDIRISIRDTYASTSATQRISTIAAILDIEKNGVGVGKLHEQGVLDIGGSVHSTGYYMSTGNGKNLKLGTGGSDVYIHNSASNKYLQLKDDGSLCYSDSKIALDYGTIQRLTATYWFYSRGETGWYNETYGGGWYMQDSTWLRSYNNKAIFTAGVIRGDGGFTVNKSDEMDITMQSNSTNRVLIRGRSAGNLEIHNYDNGTWKCSSSFGKDGTFNTGSINATGQYVTVGNYVDKFNAFQIKRYSSSFGNYLGKVGISNKLNNRTMALEIGTVDSSNAFTLQRRYEFGEGWFTTNKDNYVGLGHASWRWWAVYSANGTLQTSDARYKYILEDLNSESCYDLIKNTKLYGYMSLSKRADQYINTAEFSDELQESSQKDPNLHIGLMAQDIADHELGKYILSKETLVDEKGNELDDYIYGINDYSYTTAVHGALKHEIELRDTQIDDLQTRVTELETLTKQLISTLLDKEEQNGN